VEVNTDNIREAVLGTPLVSRIFGVEGEVFLVGGYLRDILRGVQSKDIDFVVRGDPRSAVSRIFPEGEGSVIAFRETLLVRVVMGDTTVDFSELKGKIEEDLARRDFTVNAIAWSPQRGIVDPLGGVSDIRKGRLRGISEKNFVDDPLRLLRAYRFAAELGWTIDHRTRKIITKLKRSTRVSATERITLELYKLLNGVGSVNALKQALKDGLLGEMIVLDIDKLEDNIKALSRLDSFLKKIPQELRFGLDKTFSQGLSLIGLLRTEQLLYGSDIRSSNLSLSRVILKRLIVTVKLLDAYTTKRYLNDLEIFDLFAEAGDALMDLALLTKKMSLLRKAEKFLQISPLLAAEEVMRVTGLGSGPELGCVLRDMKKLQFLGKIRSRKAAMKWLSAGRLKG
jgi:tRNA nucleotidyltransferase (CCA-adding enzyme)